ncbi:MAG TPA: P-loop NTPase fold protein [Chthoniobacterales bacterium]|nr:P-loop NTPase fold protein [Chthoniobacterales bacterium]
MSSPQADHSPKTADYQNDFLRILNNRAKEDGPKNEARSRGFVVIARGATSLTPLQTLCFDERQTYNHCFTARYRLQPSAPLGTLLLAFIDDLIKVSRGEKVTAGDLRAGKTTADSPDELKRFAEHFLERMDANLNSLLEAKHGTLETSQLAMLSEAFKSESLLTRGNRLVLFGEIAEEAATASEWQAIAETLFAQLPERVGVVLSGVPKDFVIPSKDPHSLEIVLPKGEGVGAEAQAASAIEFIDSSFHTDEPASKDELGVNDYANAIARFIVHPQTMAPLTLGINGPWGKGKSSFMNLIKRALIKFANVNRHDETRTQRWDDLARKLSAPNPESKEGPSKEELEMEFKEDAAAQEKLWNLMEVEAQKNVLSVTFNAWQFEDAKQTWAGLASQISETIEKSLSWTARQRLALGYAWKERKSELILNLLLPLAVILIVTGLVYLGYFANLKLEKPEGLALLLSLLLPGPVLLTIWFVSSQLLKVAVPISERVLSYTSMPNYREQMGFQHRVKDDLEFIRTFLIKQKGRKDCRVVVFIDDLDRCSEDKIMEVLQAINLVLGSSKFFVIVGMDTKMIHRAIRSHYKEASTEFPDSYLRKIVQISVYLPDTVSGRLADYVNTLFSLEARLGVTNHTKEEAIQKQLKPGSTASSASGLAYNLEDVLRIVPPKEAEDTADELRAFRDYCNYLDDNPREIKRLINIHRLIKILVQKQHTSWPGERQRKFVKWLIFCDRWPDLIDDALELEERLESYGFFEDLATGLEEREKNNHGTDPPPSYDRLREFAEHSATGTKPPGAAGGPDPGDILLFKDIDTEFRLAASLSQLISKSPDGKRANAERR